MLKPNEKIELLQKLRDLIMDGSQVPRLKGDEAKVEVEIEGKEIPEPIMEMAEEEKPESDDKEEDNGIKGVMMSMSRLANTKVPGKEGFKKKNRKGR
jgi:hypothetical protein